jgi:hypothetical protein
MTSKLTERLALLGAIDPDVTTASTVTSDWGNAGLFDRILALVAMGTLGSSATVDAKLEQAQDSGGTGAKDVSGTDITQQTQAGTDASDKQVWINLKADELDKANGFEYVRLSITVGTATSDIAGFLFGGDARHQPANDNDLASVVEIVN